MKRIWLLLAVFLAGCVGGTLSNKTSFEEYPLVPANPKEEVLIRRCLEAIYRDQKQFFEKTNSYQRRTTDLKVDDNCNGVLVGLRSDKTYFIGVARINHDESTVRWTINEKHEIYEHTDSDLQEDLW